jgi:Zn-dependent M28 family amino/carboxypeptidase
MRRLALLLTIASALAVPAAAVADRPGDTSRLRNAVTVNGILVHERALQRIADANGGTRASGTPGFAASRDYVARQLRSAGYRVSIQTFDFPFFQETAPPVFERTAPTARTYEEDTDFATMDFSGSGDVTGNVVPTNDVQIPPGAEPSSSNSGCEAEDYPAATAGNVALVQRGTCTFGEKAAAAQAAGATAVIVFNEGQEGRTEVLSGTLGGPVDIPVIGTSFEHGKELYDLSQGGTTTVHIVTQTFSEIRQTQNVIADSRKGDPNQTVVVGAHLDSVLDGPGINDDGSGTSTDLEVARQLARQHGGHTRNRVRFIFFGAEEEGLLGSIAYVESLTPAQIAQIKWMLDFDMLASPNFVRFVYDGDGSSEGSAGPPGSGEIEAVFNQFWNSRGLATEPTAFDGRSDYDSFTAVGIPAGGIFAGAEGIKTPEQAAIFGGTPGVAYDPCYHMACDRLSNLNLTALDQFSDAVAHSTLVFADRKRSKPAKPGKRHRKAAPGAAVEHVGHTTIR